MYRYFVSPPTWNFMTLNYKGTDNFTLNKKDDFIHGLYWCFPIFEKTVRETFFEGGGVILPKYRTTPSPD